jgi:LCP family protein required for cell wall assembly
MSVASSPIRYPDTSSPDVMRMRGWWLVALNVLLPGSAQALAGNRRLGRIGLASTLIGWGFLALVVVLSLIARDFLSALAVNFFVLFIVQFGLIYYCVLWIVLTLDTLRLVKFVKVPPAPRAWIASCAVAVLVLTSGGAAWGASTAGALNAGLSGLTGIGSLFDLANTGPSEPPIDGQYNILVLGGDSGPDREGLRTDTVQVVSVNAETGQATIVGMPRDLHNAPWVDGSPMWSVYPNGYTEEDAEYCVEFACLNTIYTDVELNHPDLYPDAIANGSSPGIEAVRDAVEGITGLTIPYFAIIDMEGATQLIDSLGGVDINVTERVAIAEPGTDPEDVPEWIEVGSQHMDGYTALMYARSRWDNTDYTRMQRQQQLQEALLQQVNPSNVATKFSDIVGAGTQMVRTNIPRSMLAYFITLAAKTKELPIVHIELTPESDTIPTDPLYPDFPSIQSYISAVVHPTPEPTPS